MRPARLLALAALGTTAALAAATPAARAGEADDGRLLRLRAFVTNPRGDAIGGLGRTDFELLVDGAPQKIASIEFSTSPRPRVFAMLLDEFHIAADDSAAVRDSLLRFVDEQLRPSDLAVVIKPLDPVTLTSIQPTLDRTPIRAAIASFEGRKGDFAPRTPFERTYLAHAPAAVAEARAQIVTSGVRALAARLVQMLAETKDVQPVIVLVTDGFARVRGNREVPGNLQTAIRIANRAGAAVYGFRPSPALAAGDDDGARIVAGLKALVTETGGELIESAVDLEAGLRRMARDLDSHYVLAYEPRHASDGRFHSVQVAVKRRDARVRAPAGYQAPFPAQLRAESAPARAMRVLRRSTLIQSWSGLTRGPDGRTRVVLTWQPAPARSGDSRAVEPDSIVVTASTVDGTVLFDDRVTSVEAGRVEGGVNRAEFDAPSGRVLVDMKILDRKGVVLDTDARDVDVPDVRRGKAMVFPPAVIRTRTAREFRLASADPDAPPIATREFRRTERLLIRVSGVNAEGAPATLVGTLMNRWRRPMRMLEPMRAPREGVTQFDLPLAPLAPGEYSVRLTAAGASEFVTFRVSR